MNCPQKSTYKPTHKKLHYLEGMRGLMAINVILCHFICVYYPQMYFEKYAKQSSGILSIFATTPLTATVNGNIAVVFFFVLTGFLVGMNIFTKEGNYTLSTFVKKSVSRYTRLLPIILLSTLITHFMMVLGLQKHLLITDSLVNTTFLQDYCNFAPDVKTLLYNIFINPFLFYSDYIGPFWTIKYEFLGYILTLLLAMTLRKKTYRRIMYVGVAFVVAVLKALRIPLADMRYIVFIMGLFVADLQFNQTPSTFDKYYKKFFGTKICLILFLVIGIYCSCCTMFSTPLYSWWFKIPGINKDLLRGVGLALLMFVSTELKNVKKVLSWKPLIILGGCSFETYAIHWPLMLSLEAFLFITFRNTMSYNASALLAFIITLPFIYIASFLIHYLVEINNRTIKKMKKN